MKGRYHKYLFILIQLVLYISFLALDIKGGNYLISNYIKFSIVLLCMLYVLFTVRKKRDRQRRFLLYAMIFTVVSDILILLLDYYFYGVLTFIIAQQIHGIRISMLGDNRKDAISCNKNIPPDNLIKDLLIRLSYQTLISFLIGLILWKVEVTFDRLLAASIFYFISILTNTVRSLRLSFISKNKNIKYLAAGFVMFLLCDINVGMFNMSDFINLGEAYKYIYLFSSILMWTFYAPSQVLISLSVE